MIMLEFRLHKYHEKAVRVLEKAEISFRTEMVQEELGNSWIYFFEEEIKYQSQQDALSKVRYFERNDQGERRDHAFPNLGIPL